MFRLLTIACTAAACAAPSLHAQWTIQDSRTTADLRGIQFVGNGVAWASGTHGTVLRTEDMGFVWQVCTVPVGADKLDFRGVQAFDANTAIVMSSGTGDQSRLYKTTDGCQTWKLIATNPDKEGFWDSMHPYIDVSIVGQDSKEAGEESVLIVGDSVDGDPKVWHWREKDPDGELRPVYEVRGKVAKGEGSFAASNSILEVASGPQVDKRWLYKFRWASETPEHVYVSYLRDEITDTCEPCVSETGRAEVPMAGGNSTAGIFSFHFRTQMIGVAVGGDYSKPDSMTKSAAYSGDGGQKWQLALTPPRGYRSSVAYDGKTKVWIAVGPTGSDISRDDGANWNPLLPGKGDIADADKRWNALSLPFVVGPKGRIGILRDDAVKHAVSEANTLPH